MDDVWKSPESDAAFTAVFSANPFEGASTDPMDVPKAVMADAKANLGGYFASTFGYLGVNFALVFAMIVLMGLCILPGALMEHEIALAVGGVLAFFLYFGLIIALAFVVAPLMMASLMRGLDAQRRGEGPVGLMSSVNQVKERAGPVLALYAITQGLALVGIFFFYIPGLVAMAIGSFAMPIVVFEEVSPIDALKLAWKHATTHGAWHLGVWILLFLAIICLELTFVGLLILPPVMAAWQLYAYRLTYGEAGAAATLAE